MKTRWRGIQLFIYYFSLPLLDRFQQVYPRRLQQIQRERGPGIRKGEIFVVIIIIIIILSIIKLTHPAVEEIFYYLLSLAPPNSPCYEGI